MNKTGNRFAALVAAAACVALPAQAQVKTGAESGTGLTGGEIPPLLKQIQADPYRPPAAPACQTAPAEIHEISKVIGPDFNSATIPQTREEDYKERGAGVARSGCSRKNCHRGLPSVFEPSRMTRASCL